MKKILLTLVAVAVLAVAWILISPLFLNKTVEDEFPLENLMAEPSVSEEESDSLAENEEVAESEKPPGVLKSGNFVDIDDFHQGSGEAGIYSLSTGGNLLRFEDLEVTNGPDLRVYLAKSNEVNESSDLDEGFVDLGKLKGNRGDQNYEIPDDVDISEYNTVVIYCRAFRKLFSTAKLN